ncbi:helix-turn-helix domain-containing protein [Nocardia cyriacigeorgica]|uniref:helix-turn-helix domain-containing protein n=1 Tax=Nocardia cyriacigeorgica TaxID=135487 RepID=UPI002457B892|nr:helix-turn-helix transcriptional regulator [Nocardia cyriacigeorgica]
MAKLTGPTIPRWQLGEELGRLRRAAAMSEAEVADRLGCSESKIKKIEAGYVGVVRAELLAMLDMYGMTDSGSRDELLELQRLGKQRGWWLRFGAVPAPLAQLLDLEGAATTLRIFEPMVVHGLLQTEGYARATAGTVMIGATEERREREVALRLARQERVLAEPPEMWVILDEAVLHRVVGSPAVMREQLEHLIAMSERINLQVVPFSHGGYPGTLGAFTIFEFAENTHSPVVYVEGPAGNLYMEREADLQRSSVVFAHMIAAALSQTESRKLIARLAEQY